jgi:hypothetical protein
MLSWAVINQVSFGASQRQSHAPTSLHSTYLQSPAVHANLAQYGPSFILVLSRLRSGLSFEGHASLHLDTARTAIGAGWAVAHPWADQRAGWEGFVMIYTPITETELEVVLQLVRGSYTYNTGVALAET